jgi:hypothetical protein
MSLHPILGPPRGNLSTISLESLKPIRPVIVIYLSVPERVSFCVISLVNNHSRSYPPTHSSNSALYIKHFLTRFIYPFHTIYSLGHQTAKYVNIRNEAQGKKKGYPRGIINTACPSHPKSTVSDSQRRACSSEATMSRRQSQILQQKKKFPVIKLSSSYRESKWPGPKLKNRETKGKKKLRCSS